MIFILSEETDHSTNEVIKWLKFYNKNFVRVNDVDKIELEECSISSKKQFFNLIISTKHSGDILRVNSDKITAYWYRRGDIRLNSSGIKNIRHPAVTQFAITQIRDVEEYLLYKLSLKKSINKLSDIFINKMIAIDAASAVGLKIPETLITKNIDHVIKFKKKGSIITKSFKEGYININPIFLSGPTIKLENEVLEKHTTFNVSLFQDCIDKFADIRIFYLNSTFYAMAIFSQNDESTNVDFRNYNEEKPNRNVPFKLPKAVSTKLTKLIEKLQINSGSIDMVLDKKNNFYFLEVNPIGQFEMTSKPCNYLIQKEIAKELTNGRTK
jgi:ATP-GRASP peptide maturase of grasp-with-spasm system